MGRSPLVGECAPCRCIFSPPTLNFPCLSIFAVFIFNICFSLMFKEMVTYK